MDKVKEPWLQALEERSRQKQEQFLNHIADQLQRPRQYTKPQRHIIGAPQFWQQLQMTDEEKVAKFTENFVAAGGYVTEVNNIAEASSFVADKALQMKAHYLIRHDVDLLAQLKLEQALPNTSITVWNENYEANGITQAAQADIGVAIVDHAVAYTGSLVLKSSKQKGRSVSLLPTMLIAIVPRSIFVAKLGEVLQPLDEAGREALPAGVHFVSGPSRSADIENDLTIGVHGPGIVYAVIVNDL